MELWVTPQVREVTTTEKALFNKTDFKIVNSGVSDANPLLKAIYWSKMINGIKR